MGYKEYESDNYNWIENPIIVQTAMNKYYNNPKAHYELLRLIIYKLEEGIYNRKYLLFLKTLLFTLLEENPEIYFNPRLNEILRKYPEIFLNNQRLSISNTQLNQLIDKKIVDQKLLLSRHTYKKKKKKKKPLYQKKKKKKKKKK